MGRKQTKPKKGRDESDLAVVKSDEVSKNKRKKKNTSVASTPPIVEEEQDALLDAEDLDFEDDEDGLDLMNSSLSKQQMNAVVYQCLKEIDEELSLENEKERKSVIRNTAMNCFSGMRGITEAMIQEKMEEIEESNKEQMLQTKMSQAFQELLGEMGEDGELDEDEDDEFVLMGGDGGSDEDQSGDENEEEDGEEEDGEDESDE